MAPSFGALTPVTAADVSDSLRDRGVAEAESRKFNDGVQAVIFNPDALRQTFRKAPITKPLPHFQDYYDLTTPAPPIDGKDWNFGYAGLVDNKKACRTWKSPTARRRSSQPSPAHI